MYVHVCMYIRTYMCVYIVRIYVYVCMYVFAYVGIIYGYSSTCWNAERLRNYDGQKVRQSLLCTQVAVHCQCL